MKAKKVYEFINPKTDKYKLEDTLPLGLDAIRIKEVENILVDDGLKLDDVKIEVQGKFISIELFDDEDVISFSASQKIPLLIIKDGDGDKVWYKKGQIHRIDGPSIEYASGNKYYYLNGKYQQ